MFFFKLQVLMRPLTWPFYDLINEIKLLKDAYQVFVKIFNDVFPYFKQSKLQPGQMHFFSGRLQMRLLKPAQAVTRKLSSAQLCQSQLPVFSKLS